MNTVQCHACNEQLRLHYEYTKARLSCQKHCECDK